MELFKLLVVGMVSSLSLLACAPAKQKVGVQNSLDGIIGGTDVLQTDKINTSTVAVYDDAAGELCTGVLVAENIVLTAAHCIGYSKEDMYILFDNILSDRSPLRRAEKIEVSPYYPSRRFENTDRSDLALIRFLGKAPEGYKPARFLDGSQNIANEVLVTIAGYGLSDAVNEKGQGILRTTQVKIVDALFGAGEVLVNQKDGQGACRGDSGGPAFLEINGEYFLWGITSRGVVDTQRLCNAFAAYTNLFAHRTWMNRMIGKMSKPINSF